MRQDAVEELVAGARRDCLRALLAEAADPARRLTKSSGNGCANTMKRCLRMLLTLCMALLLYPDATRAMSFSEFKNEVAAHDAGRLDDTAFIALCRRVIALDAAHDDWYRAIAHVDLGRAYLARREGGKAKETFSRCIQDLPDESICYFGMSLYYRTHKNSREAVRYALLAADKNPDNAAAEAIRQNAQDLPLVLGALDPATLWRAFNGARAADPLACLNKTLAVGGIVDTIESAPGGDIRVTLRGEGADDAVTHCLFGPDARHAVDTLEQGQYRIIAGRCAGVKSGTGVQLLHCRLLQ